MKVRKSAAKSASAKSTKVTTDEGAPSAAKQSRLNQKLANQRARIEGLKGRIEKINERIKRALDRVDALKEKGAQEPKKAKRG